MCESVDKANSLLKILRLAFLVHKKFTWSQRIDLLGKLCSREQIEIVSILGVFASFYFKKT